MDHFSAMYNMIDSRVPRDSKGRAVIEREFYGREIMNLISCKGPERVERPESYKQWQARITQAGFRHLPLDRSQMKVYRAKLEALSSKDFVIYEEDWILQGWKGRILIASSSWVPA